MRQLSRVFVLIISLYVRSLLAAPTDVSAGQDKESYNSFLVKRRPPINSGPSDRPFPVLTPQVPKGWWWDVSPSEDIVPDMPITEDREGLPRGALDGVMGKFWNQIAAQTVWGFQESVRGLATRERSQWAIYWNLTNEDRLLWPRDPRFLQLSPPEGMRLQGPRRMSLSFDQPTPLDTKVWLSRQRLPNGPTAGQGGMDMMEWLRKRLQPEGLGMMLNHQHQPELPSPRYTGKLQFSRGGFEFTYRMLRIGDRAHPIEEIVDQEVLESVLGPSPT